MILGQEGAWEGLRDARILLTGGTGFMGTWLLELFRRANQSLALGAQVTVLTRDRSAFGGRSPHLAQDPGVVLREGDVRSFTPLGVPFTHVIHGAASSHGSPAALEHLDTLVGGTRRVLEEAEACGARRFVLLSSGAVYGRQPADLPELEETYAGAPDPLAAGTVYAQGKRMAEHLCALFAQRSPLAPIAIRGFAFVGPHLPLDAHFAIGNFLRDALRGGPVRVEGDGTPFRSYLYASEMAAWIWRLLTDGQPGQAYNLGSDRAITIAALAQAIARQFGTACQIARAAQPGLPAERYVPSIQRLRQDFGLVPRIGLEEACRRTADWHSS